MQHAFGLVRNDYDRIGHFAQSGAKSEAFLGTQGHPWDTQEDMATALAGAIVAQLVLPRWHDRQIDAIEARRALRRTP